MNNIEFFESLNWCTSYVKYIQLKLKGLRKEANIVLDQFFLDFALQPKESRRVFINRVNEIVYNHNEYNLYLPVNLYSKVLLPEIERWIRDEPNNPIPLIWTRDLTNLRKAIVIDPDNQIGLNLFAEIIINKISMNQHELTSGFSYSGSPNQDIELIDFFLNKVNKINDENKRNNLIKKLNNLKRCAIMSL